MVKKLKHQTSIPPEKRRPHQRADGTFHITVATGERLPSGALKYKHFYGATLKEAKSKADEFKIKVATQGGVVGKKSITIGDWIHKHLLINVRTTVAVTTFDRYMDMYNNHIANDPISNIEVQKLTALQFKEYLNNKDYLAKATLSKLKGIFNQALESAIDNAIIITNPITRVKLPTTCKDKKYTSIMNTTESDRYKEAIKEDYLYLLLLTARYTGMRRGELIGLRWGDIDLANCTIAIKRTIVRAKVYDENGNVTGSKLFIKSPKSRAGNRTVLIPNSLARELELSRPITYNQDTLVFPSKIGTLLDPDNVTRAHAAACYRANIKHFKLHSLRHLFISELINSGVPAKAVSTQVGHADLSTTINEYTHVTQQANEVLVGHLNNLYN